MSTYKVPQDVEADDKLIGPFSFKQFIFILIAFAMGWLAYMVFQISPPLVLLPIPFMVGFLILGLPLRKDQPTDVYVAALINYWMRPKTRLWDQEGMREHVIVTAPKKVRANFSDGLSHTEVRSKLTSLAKTMDTRGWSIKNADQDSFSGIATLEASDRLIMPDTATSPMEDLILEPTEDILDTENSTVGRTITRLQEQTSKNYMAALHAKMEAASQAVQPPEEVVPVYNPYPVMHQRVIKPDPSTTEMTDVKPTDILEVHDQTVSATDRPASDDFEKGGVVKLH